MSELSIGQLRGLTVNSNIVTVPSGHTLYAPGHVVQVVNVDYAGRASQGFSGNTLMDVVGLEARITPKSINSRIVIQARWFGEMTPQGVVWDSVFGVSRNGVQIARQTDPSGTVINGITTASISYTADDANSTPEVMNLSISDFPTTTSEVVYKITFLSSVGGTLFTNRMVGWSGNVTGYELGTCSMMLMEIAQ